MGMEHHALEYALPARRSRHSLALAVHGLLR
jgi:hypothetical protein